MLNIKVWRDPYQIGVNLTRPRYVDIQPGITVLVGCNGAGKSTLLHNVRDDCKTKNIPVHLFDNLKDGGATENFGAILGGFGEEGDTIESGISLWTASEGEAIKLNIGRNSRLYNDFFKCGYYKDKKYRLSRAFRDEEDKAIESKQRVLLFDAIDSGMSIDAIIEIKALFDILIKDTTKMGIELYIIVVANEYEMAREQQCMDITDGRYLTFKDYEDYRKFVINSRKKKEKRLEKQEEYVIKMQKKEEENKRKREEKYLSKISAIKNKAETENRKLTRDEEYKIRAYQDYIDGIRDYIG